MHGGGAPEARADDVEIDIDVGSRRQAAREGRFKHRGGAVDVPLHGERDAIGGLVEHLLGDRDDGMPSGKIRQQPDQQRQHEDEANKRQNQHLRQRR